MCHRQLKDSPPAGPAQPGWSYPAADQGYGPAGQSYPYGGPGYAPAGQQYPAAPGYPQPGQPYPPVPGYPPGSPYYQRPRTNPVAIAALVCGIVQFFLLPFVVLNILGAAPAVICGAIGMRQTRARGERGRGMAIAGLVLGIVGLIIFVLIVALIVIGLAVNRAGSSG